MEGWKSGRIENRERIKSERIEKKKKILSYVFGWEDRKVERWKTIKNVVDINLQLYPY